MDAMAAVAPLFELATAPAEQRFLLHGVPWKEYVLLRDLLDSPGLRMTYLRGTLEIMSPSTDHEMWKTNIARLVELFAHVTGIDLYGYGSATFRREVSERGAEPDECYLVGQTLTDVPQIALEVIHTTPLLNKLEVYAGLGIREVWVFRNGGFTIHELSPDGTTYGVRPDSALVPSLDFAAVARFAVRRDTPQALREFEATLRK